jgi:hypothetical protein
MVTLARDEELGIGGTSPVGTGAQEPSKALPAPPPAYGLWRGSVVGLKVDPSQSAKV